MNCCRALLCFIGAMLLSAQTAHAQTSVPHTSLDVSIDGKLDDPAWAAALAVELAVETYPGENVPAPVATTAYLVRNDTHLFIAFRAEDPDVENIRASFRDRDAIMPEDWVGVSLDTFNDERRSYEFYVNPYGAQYDALFDDVLDNTDDSWDTVWESMGTIGDTGYVVEMAIPFRSLRFANLAGGNTWGIRFLRRLPRDVAHEIADTAQDRARNCTLCQYAKYAMGAIPANTSRGIEVTPTLSVLHTQQREPGEPWDDDTDYEPGVDFAWNINTQNVLSATLNPDFSQVESDALLLDVNTAFALFYPEKRTFFLEGIDYFQTMENLVFTRNVVDPDAGVKLTGKTGRHTYATFYARDTVTSFVIPGPLYSSVGVIDDASDDFVARYRMDLGAASTIGVLATARESGDYFNHLAALDGRWVFNEQNSLTWQAMKSETRYPDDLAEENGQPTGEFGGDAVYAIYQFRNRDWDAKAFLRDYSDGFRADMGFVYKAGYDRQGILVDRFFYGEGEHWWHTARAHVNWTVTHASDGTLIRRCNETAAEVQGPLQSILYLNYANLSEYWDGVLYDGHFIEFYGETRPHPQWIVQVSTIVGDRIDYANSRYADSIEFAFWVQYKPSDHLTMSTDFALNELEYKGDRIFTAWINDFRATYQFNLKHRLELTLQFQSLDRVPSMYNSPVSKTDNDLASRLVYSYKINPRTVFYAGYSDHAVETDEIGSLASTDRTAFVKFSYGFDF